MTVQSGLYPVTYSVDEPVSLSRWLWLFKGLLLIPHIIVLGILGIVSWFTLFASWVAILITGKRPRGLWNFHLGIMMWSIRVGGYSSHFTDKYPAFSMDADAHQYPVRLEAEYRAEANRLTTFFRFLLAIPHLIVLYVLSIAAFFAWLVFIVVVIVTGKPHADMFKFLVGVSRWEARASCYYWLITDEYPPFSLD